MGTNTMEKKASAASEKKANLSMKQYGMVLALIAVYIIFAVLTGGKNLTPMNVNSLIMQNGYVVILAVGMLLCVLTGNVDLGVGSVVACCGAVAGTLIVDFGMATPVAMIAALAVGMVFGMFVGFFVSIGVFGDSYYGLIENVPLLRSLYTGIFYISSYTRNGIFFAPIYIVNPSI